MRNQHVVVTMLMSHTPMSVRMHIDSLTLPVNKPEPQTYLMKSSVASTLSTHHLFLHFVLFQWTQEACRGINLLPSDVKLPGDLSQVFGCEGPHCNSYVSMLFVIPTHWTNSQHPHLRLILNTGTLQGHVLGKDCNWHLNLNSYLGCWLFQPFDWTQSTS